VKGSEEEREKERGVPGWHVDFFLLSFFSPLRKRRKERVMFEFAGLLEVGREEREGERRRGEGKRVFYRCLNVA
jgi:hypothetical protein